MPLSKPVHVMTFDFYEAEAHMQPSEVQLLVPIHTQGVCNAIAFWFELYLDENTSLSTSPYVDKVSPHTHFISVYKYVGLYCTVLYSTYKAK